MAASMQTLPLGAVRKAHKLIYLRLLQEQLRVIPSIMACNTNCLHTSSTYHIDRRKDKAVSRYLYYKDHEKTMRHRNLAILDLPDYSYTDGRPTELSLSQNRRQQRNYELAKQVVQLVGEIEQAQNLLKEQQEAETRRQRERLESRLKHKQTQFKE